MTPIYLDLEPLGPLVFLAPSPPAPTGHPRLYLATTYLSFSQSPPLPTTVTPAKKGDCSPCICTTFHFQAFLFAFSSALISACSTPYPQDHAQTSPVPSFSCPALAEFAPSEFPKLFKINLGLNTRHCCHLTLSRFHPVIPSRPSGVGHGQKPGAAMPGGPGGHAQIPGD